MTTLNKKTMWTDEEDAERRSHDDIMKTPIYQKALDILQMVEALEAYIETEDYIAQQTLEMMALDAMQLAPKIAAAGGTDLYDIKMEHAAIVRMCARQILVNSNLLSNINPSTNEYILLLRNEIDDFRLLFVDWVDRFDPWDYIIDRWGLFNPPGVSAHDKDPDDDIPFNPDDILGD